MKNIIKNIFILSTLVLLVSPLFSYAITVPWERPATGRIHPQQVNDDVLIGRTASSTNSKLEVSGTTTANNFVATSTTATSSLQRTSITGAISLLGEYFTNFTSYVRSLFSATAPLSYNSSTGEFSCPTCGSGGSAFPFTVTGYGVSTSTTVGFLNGIMTTASSTLNGGIKIDTSTTTSGTTTNLAILGVTAGRLLATNAIGTVVSTSTIGNNQLQNSTIALTDANSTLTIGGSPASLGGTLTATLNLASQNIWTGASTTFTNGVSITNGTTTNATSTTLAVSGSGTSTRITNNLNVGGNINIGGSATNTFTNGLSITGGCFAINNVCLSTGGGSLSGGTAGMLASWINGTTLTATGTPTFANFFGTSSATSTLTGQLLVDRIQVGSTTSTSTFANGLNISAGCFSINGVCISGSGAGSSSWVIKSRGVATSSGTHATGRVATTVPLTANQVLRVTGDVSINCQQQQYVHIAVKPSTGATTTIARTYSDGCAVFQYLQRSMTGEYIATTSMNAEIYFGLVDLSIASTTNDVFSAGTSSIAYEILEYASGGGGGGTPGGSDTQVQFNDGGSFGGAVGFVWNKLKATLGVGTTTPTNAILTLSSSTAPQIRLTDGSLTSAQWIFRNMSGAFALTTTTPDTYASSSNATALYITSNGKVSIGTSTNFATLHLWEQLGTGASPSFLMGGNPGGDTDYWQARITDNGTDDDDLFQIGRGTTPGNTPLLTLTHLGNFGVGSTSPMSKLSVHAGSADTNLNLFTVASSTASATTTLFNITNTGTVEVGTGATNISLNGPALSYFTNGLGVGSTTPWAGLSVATSSTNSIVGNLVASFATSSNATAFLNFTATSTEAATTSPFAGFRLNTGSSTPFNYGTLDQVNILGRINQYGWLQSFYDAITLNAADTQEIADGGPAGVPWKFMEDNIGSFLPVNSLGSRYVTLRTWATTTNNGAGLFFTPTASLSSASNTPIYESRVRIDPITATNTIAHYVGFTSTSPVGTTFETVPTTGCYFTASSTRPNWYFVGRSNSGAQTIMDTGIASSTSVTARGSFHLLRIELTTDRCVGFITIGGTGSGAQQRKRIEVSTTTPTGAIGVSAGTYFANGAAGPGAGLQEFDVQNSRIWYQDPLW